MPDSTDPAPIPGDEQIRKFTRDVVLAFVITNITVAARYFGLGQIDPAIAASFGALLLAIFGAIGRRYFPPAPPAPPAIFA